jgi:twitching motility protein PilT
MAQRRDRAGLAQEEPHRLVLLAIGANELHGDRSLQDRVVGAEDDAEPSLPSTSPSSYRSRLTLAKFYREPPEGEDPNAAFEGAVLACRARRPFMKTIEEMLRNLARADVLEFALVSGRLPCIKVGTAYEPVDADAPSLDDALQMLVHVGGSRYVESLSPKPTSWTSRLDGVGVIAITAVMRDNVVQARFRVSRRDASPKLPPVEARRAYGSVPPPEASEAPQARRRPSVSDDAEEPTLQTSAAVAAPPRGRAEPAPVGPKPARSAREERTLGERTLGEKTLQERTLESRSDDRIVERRSPVTVDAREPTPDSSRSVDQTPGYPMVPPPPFDEEEIDQVSHPSLVAPLSERSALNALAPEREPLAPPPRPQRPSAAPPPPVQMPRAQTRNSRIPFRGSRPPPSEDVASSDADRARIVAPGARREAGLDTMLAVARAEDASDLHVVAGRPMLLRTLGRLEPRGEPVSAAAVEAMVSSVVPAALRPALARDGSCDFALNHTEYGRFRVNASRQRTGYKLCFRLIPQDIPTLTDLGLPESLAGATRHHQGLILVTGPTGHGKTTTLAALVAVINRDTNHHIITVEDPIEHVHPRRRALMSQREVLTHTRSFASALNAALREDPDVIVVGELRDVETVRMAVAASETGHLVLGTMNTPSAAKTIDRVIDLFPPGDQAQVRMTLAGGLRLIVSQRLVPTADGAGLVAAVEVLPGSIPLWSLIRDNKTFQIPSLQQRGKALGITRLDDSLAELVRSGTVTLEAARAFAEQPDALGKRSP